MLQRFFIDMKTILAFGTKKTSYGRVIKDFFEKRGFKVCLLSRDKSSDNLTNTFVVDIAKPNTYKNILSVFNDIQTIIFSQDTGTAFGDFEKLTYEEIEQFINSKILGSILFVRFIMKELANHPNSKINLIWMCGSYELKPKDYMLYHTANIAIKSFVDELNKHYTDIIEAYYLVTPFMDKTTIGILYNKKHNKGDHGENPQILLPYFEKIISGNFKQGIVKVKSHFTK